MKVIKTVAVCALVALGVGATSATAASLITSAQIKDGTIKIRDLSPALQSKVKLAGKPGANGATGATGATGLDGKNGRDGKNGKDGTNGTNGTNGQDGRDGVRYDRLTGGIGEVSIAHGNARLATGADQWSWAQIRQYPTDLKVSEIDELAFTAKASHEGTTYMKVTATGGNSILFSPNTQAGGEQVGEWVSYRVNGEGSTVRLNDDAGEYPADEMSWSDLVQLIGDEHVKDVRVTNGAAGPVGDGAATLVDEITVNGDTLDFE